VETVETIATDISYLFQSLSSLLALEIAQNNVQLHINAREDCKLYKGKNGMCGFNSEIIANTEIYEVSVSIYFLYECQITEPPTFIVGQVVSERTVSVLFTGELGNGYCDALMSAGKKVKYF
jgi:hypothetical protein